MRTYPLLPSRLAGPDLYIPLSLREELRTQLGRRHTSAVVILFAPEGVSVEDRDERAQALKYAGIYDLARKLTSAVVPRGSVLALADLEEGCNVFCLPIESVFGDGDDEIARQSGGLERHSSAYAVPDSGVNAKGVR